jgi:hypothetical protein
VQFALISSTPAGPFRHPSERLGSRAMHLRAPSIDKGVQAFVWTVVFFLFIFFGMKSVDVDGATSLIVALAASFLIFVFIRVRGDVKDG